MFEYLIEKRRRRRAELKLEAALSLLEYFIGRHSLAVASNEDNRKNSSRWEGYAKALLRECDRLRDRFRSITGEIDP